MLGRANTIGVRGLVACCMSSLQANARETVRGSLEGSCWHVSEHRALAMNLANVSAHPVRVRSQRSAGSPITTLPLCKRRSTKSVPASTSASMAACIALDFKERRSMSFAKPSPVPEFDGS